MKTTNTVTKYYCVLYINLIPISQLNMDSITASFNIGVLELIEPKNSNNSEYVFNNFYKYDRVNNMKDFENSSIYLSMLHEQI